MKFKEYEMPDGRKAVFEYDENGVGKITLECMDMLMGQLIAYKRCIQSRSFWDAKHCDGCMFYDDCPFNPREDEDEPQTNADQHVQRVEYVGNVKRCRKCKHIESEYQTPISSDGKYYTYVVCTVSECRFEPKDEPQTERSRR